MTYRTQPTAAAPTPWLPYYKPTPGARVRLFCLPYTGGQAALFHRWRRFLPDEVELCPVELPGRGTRLREPPQAEFPALLDALVAALVPFLDRPFALFGHSLGGVLAFEFARRLRGLRAAMPRHIFISARRAPQLPFEERANSKLPEPEFIEYLRSLNGTPEEIFENPEVLELILPTLRADFSLGETYRYRPEPPLDCPFTVFGGASDVDVQREHLEPWREQTSSSFSFHMLPGDHFFINTHPEMLLRVVSQQLRQVASRTD